jgi:hypothetical protein
MWHTALKPTQSSAIRRHESAPECSQPALQSLIAVNIGRCRVGGSYSGDVMSVALWIPVEAVGLLVRTCLHVQGPRINQASNRGTFGRKTTAASSWSVSSDRPFLTPTQRMFPIGSPGEPGEEDLGTSLFLLQLGYLEVTVQEKLRSGCPGPVVKVEGCCDLSFVCFHASRRLKFSSRVFRSDSPREAAQWLSRSSRESWGLLWLVIRLLSCEQTSQVQFSGI